MRRELVLAASLMLLLGACSRGADDKSGLTAKERADLDNAAAMLDDNQTIDTSPDSLVLNEGAAAEASAPLEGNQQAAPAPANGSATMNSAAPANSSNQR